MDVYIQNLMVSNGFRKVYGELIRSNEGWVIIIACGMQQHEANTTDDFHDGFVYYNKNGIQDDAEGVIVWRGKKKWG